MFYLNSVSPEFSRDSRGGKSHRVHRAIKQRSPRSNNRHRDIRTLSFDKYSFSRIARYCDREIVLNVGIRDARVNAYESDRFAIPIVINAPSSPAPTFRVHFARTFKPFVTRRARSSYDRSHSIRQPRAVLQKSRHVV